MRLVGDIGHSLSSSNNAKHRTLLAYPSSSEDPNTLEFSSFYTSRLISSCLKIFEFPEFSLLEDTATERDWFAHTILDTCSERFSTSLSSDALDAVMVDDEDASGNCSCALLDCLIVTSNSKLVTFLYAKAGASNVGFSAFLNGKTDASGCTITAILDDAADLSNIDLSPVFDAPSNT